MMVIFVASSPVFIPTFADDETSTCYSKNTFAMMYIYIYNLLLLRVCNLLSLIITSSYYYQYCYILLQELL